MITDYIIEDIILLMKNFSDELRFIAVVSLSENGLASEEGHLGDCFFITTLRLD